MEERNLPQIVIGKFKEHKARIFSSAGDWERHLQALGLSAMNVTPDPVLIASDGALWGAIHHQGLLPDTVIVSDDAGQFRVGARALCWIHLQLFRAFVADQLADLVFLRRRETAA